MIPAGVAVDIAESTLNHLPRPWTGWLNQRLDMQGRKSVRVHSRIHGKVIAFLLK